MKPHHKAFIGTIFGTIAMAELLFRFNSIPDVWYFRVPTLLGFACGLMLFICIGRWLESDWKDEDAKNQDGHGTS